MQMANKISFVSLIMENQTTKPALRLGYNFKKFVFLNQNLLLWFESARGKEHELAVAGAG
jgi:hypothetical protein